MALLLSASLSISRQIGQLVNQQLPFIFVAWVVNIEMKFWYGDFIISSSIKGKTRHFRQSFAPQTWKNSNYCNFCSFFLYRGALIDMKFGIQNYLNNIKVKFYIEIKQFLQSYQPWTLKNSNYFQFLFIFFANISKGGDNKCFTKISCFKLLCVFNIYPAIHLSSNERTQDVLACLLFPLLASKFVNINELQ